MYSAPGGGYIHIIRGGELLAKQLVKKYEEIAMRIFNYDKDTCPLLAGKVGTDVEENSVNSKKLVYYFYTKRGGKGVEYLGFLHTSFYQYFLARFIVSAVRNLGVQMTAEKASIEVHGGQPVLRPLPKDFVKLFAGLRAEKLSDPDMWKLVAQLARIEQSKENHVVGNECLLYHTWENRIQKSHIRCVLECLNRNNLFSDTIVTEDPYERKVDHERREGERNRYQEMENAIFNLISACAAIENGCIEGLCKDNSAGIEVNADETERIAYGGKSGYSNISVLLKRGEYSGIYLNGINLDDCDLEKANLSEAHMRGTKMNRANLSGADLTGAQLEGAQLSGASLVRTNFENAILNNAVLYDALLIHANMNCAVMVNAKLKKSHMNWANLEGAVLKEANLERAILSGAIINNSNMEKAHCQCADLRESYLKSAVLTSAVLTQAKMERTYLAFACLEKADLRSTNLTDANFRDAYMVGAKINKRAFQNMTGAVLRGAVFDQKQIEQANKYGIDLIRRMETEEQKAVASAIEAKNGLKNVIEDSHIVFGRYPQYKKKSEDCEFIPEPLCWRVLHVDEQNSRALLITEKLIDCIPYHDVSKNVTWEHSSLRAWMNGEFIRKAFTEEETSLIISVWNQNNDNEYRLDRVKRGGNATYDKVFALSIDEAKSPYFHGDVDRMASVTSYAKEKGSYIDKDSTEDIGWWWLRSPGSLSGNASNVITGGHIYCYGDEVISTLISVRPALWIHL